MEDREIRFTPERHWAESDANDFAVEHEIYREDAVLHYPQSGERIRGRGKMPQQKPVFAAVGSSDAQRIGYSFFLPPTRRPLKLWSDLDVQYSSGCYASSPAAHLLAASLGDADGTFQPARAL